MDAKILERISYYLAENMLLRQDRLYELVENDIGCTREEFDLVFQQLVQAYIK
jgi:hypothetical protein